ncbi:GntR family transcriptional regulator [Streptomyces sp. FXJ1.4098]|nr:GntR family transcriptional regulator [Streptomyces sp. FXJ1.4098]
MAGSDHPYMRVAERIRRSILDGALKEGEKLPPVRELARREGVSVATLGRSLDQLQVEGYITTSRRGTFVANAPEVAPPATTGSLASCAPGRFSRRARRWSSRMRN